MKHKVYQMSLYDLVCYAIKIDSKDQELVEIILKQTKIYQAQVQAMRNIRHAIVSADENIEALLEN
jgi:hypothetical protein